jgi:hypothetical protein
VAIAGASQTLAILLGSGVKTGVESAFQPEFTGSSLTF